jgi:hypothetical protein
MFCTPSKPKKSANQQRLGERKEEMSNGTITNYAQLGQYIDGILTANGQMSDTINGSPHGAFWDTMSYADFTNQSSVVPGTTISPIVVPGNASQSNLVLILQGPLQGIPQMPADGPPYFTAAQIQPIIDWINAGCPN